MGQVMQKRVLCHMRTRSADQPAQSNQHLCHSLLRQYDMYTCYSQSFQILASSVAEQDGLNLTWLKIPEDTFLCDDAQMVINQRNR